jgi:hypothetical protein
MKTLFMMLGGWRSNGLSKRDGNCRSGGYEMGWGDVDDVLVALSLVMGI